MRFWAWIIGIWILVENFIDHHFTDKYLVNLGAGEIHVIAKIRKACHTDRMTRGVKMTEAELHKYKAAHPMSNGCKWCNFENHIN